VSKQLPFQRGFKPLRLGNLRGHPIFGLNRLKGKGILGENSYKNSQEYRTPKENGPQEGVGTPCKRNFSGFLPTFNVCNRKVQVIFLSPDII